MRRMQGTDGETPIARLRPLPMWVGVGAVEHFQNETRKTEPQRPDSRFDTHRKGEFLWLASLISTYPKISEEKRRRRPLHNRER